MTPEDPQATDRFELLVVCTGNISRSPVAERLLRTGLDESVEVSSAGVGAVVGAPIDPPMAERLRAEGVDPEGFTARQLTSRLARDAQLILALTREHRSRVVELAPAVLRRTFTLAEFCRLLRSVDPQALPDGPDAVRLRAAIPLALAARTSNRATDPSDDDIADPFGGPPSEYQVAFTQISHSVSAIAGLLHS